MIEVKNISKSYRITHQKRYPAFRDRMADFFANPLGIFTRRSSREELWALKDISFDVKKGEMVGLIGRNGAGKTTILKVLSRITCPTFGEARLNGRVGSLLELGTGFHSELTGTENIYFNGAILGMKKKEIDKKFDEIVGFSGIEKFLDTPVKRYSSGMKVRLAFSVAAHLEPEILLVDEVLAVGDAEFQKKCLGKMQDVSKAGRTIIFVSHDMAAIRNLCKRVILFDSGRKIMDRDSDTVISYYLDKNLQEGAKVTEKDLAGKIEGFDSNKAHSIEIKEIALMSQEGSLRNSFRSNESVKVVVSYECLSPVNDLRITVQVVDDDNRPVLTAQNADDPKELSLYKRMPGYYKSSVAIPPDTFGDNRLYISLHIEHPTVDYFAVNKILGFDVEFQGYNNVRYARFGKSFIRPRLMWDTEVTDKK